MSLGYIASSTPLMMLHLMMLHFPIESGQHDSGEPCSHFQLRLKSMSSVSVESKAEETNLVIYPSYAIAEPQGWKVFVAGCAFQNRDVTFRKRMLLKILRRAMKVEPQMLASELFKERIQPFMATGEKGQRVEIQFGNRTIALTSPTKRDGHFRGSFQLSTEEYKKLEQSGEIRDNTLRFTAWLSGSSDNRRQGTVVLCPQKGLSIVSDVDDTIKITNVGNLKELLTNTFLRKFETVGGMADVYQSWASRGGFFHYVSSSPWQLFEPLVQLQVEGGFPHGSIHLRDFRWRDQMFSRVKTLQRRGKGAVIRLLIKNMPERKFLLVGDSSEKDPEIYRQICLRYPEQIRGLFIRQVVHKPIDRERLSKINKSLTNVPVCVFSNASELGDLADDLVPELKVS